jgi:hypothetical protein
MLALRWIRQPEMSFAEGRNGMWFTSSLNHNALWVFWERPAPNKEEDER